MARRLAAYNANDDDAVLAELSASIGRHFLAVSGDNRLQLRCLRRPSQPLSQTGRAASAVDKRLPYETIYAADVFQDSTGTVRVIKQVGSREAAPVKKTVPRGAGAPVDN